MNLSEELFILMQFFIPMIIGTYIIIKLFYGGMIPFLFKKYRRV